MRWADFERAAPGLAGLGRERLLAPGVVLVGTIRHDGSPRISPVEPFVLDGQLWLSMLWGSHKAADLDRDPRVLVHSIVTSRDGGDGEFKLRGWCRAETDRTVLERYADAVSAALGWRPDLGRGPPVLGGHRLCLFPAIRRRHRRPVHRVVAARSRIRPQRYGWHQPGTCRTRRPGLASLIAAVGAQLTSNVVEPRSRPKVAASPGADGCCDHAAQSDPRAPPQRWRWIPST